MIRSARKSDLQYILLLWKELAEYHEKYDDVFALKPGAEEKFKQYAQSVFESSKKLSIVYDDGEIKGYLFAEILAQPPVYRVETVGIISEIAVFERFRRMGIGVALVKAAEKWFQGEGIYHIDCQVAVKNPISPNFWKKLGYEPHSFICRSNLNNSKK
ncbi:MAG: GNAT family N-acetyltransferase [Bacteroidales bacterium]|nr:GNAT family N-acetyltransferase [Bacteroidales bacterium]